MGTPVVEHPPLGGEQRLVTIDDIRAARERVTGVIRETPVDRSETLSALAGRPVILKPENRQRTGSFKIRGAYNRISRLPAGHAGGGRVGRQPRPGGGPGGQRCRAPGDHLHAGERAPAQGRGDPRLRGRRCAGRRRPSTTASPAPGPSATPTGGRVRAPLRRPADHRRPGHHRAGAGRRGARGDDGGRPHRRRRADLGDRRRPGRRSGPTCGSSGSRPPGRRPW